MIFVALGGSWWGLVPFGRHVWTMYQNRQNVVERLVQLEDKYSVLSSFSESDLVSQSNELLRAIPGDKSVATLMSTIETTAAQGGVRLQSLTIVSPGSLATEAAKRQTAAEKQIGAGIIASGVTIEGPVTEVKQMLVRFGGVRRIVSTRGLELTIRDNGSARANIVLDGYWAPLPTTLPDVVSKVTPLTEKEEVLMVQISSFPVAFEVATGPISFPPRPNPFSL